MVGERTSGDAIAPGKLVALDHLVEAPPQHEQRVGHDIVGDRVGHPSFGESL
jgi:hypothetical protein